MTAQANPVAIRRLTEIGPRGGEKPSGGNAVERSSSGESVMRDPDKGVLVAAPAAPHRME
jgi:hypothetical protein